VKVLFLAGLDVSLPGGLETHLRELALALTARGHAVDIAGRPVPYPPLSTVERFDAARYDVIHHHAGRWPAGLDAGERYVGTLHFCVAGKMAAYVRMGRLRTLVNPANWRALGEERASVRRRGRFIAVSARVRDEFARHHGFDGSRAVVIPNGILPGSPRQGRSAWRERNGIPEDLPVLLTVGRRDFVKGHALLERAWSRFRSGGRDALWVRVGDDAPAREPGRWTTGPVPHEDVREWIAAADVGALPSHYEGCSVALLEMAGGGLYTLAHDVGNAAEVIRPGVGELVAPRESDWVAALGHAFSATGATARPAPGLDAEYSWDAIAARVEGVYAMGGTGATEARGAR
jgi:glycosyltransferase involved in cell wall biosynthesis